MQEKYPTRWALAILWHPKLMNICYNMYGTSVLRDTAQVCTNYATSVWFQSMPNSDPHVNHKIQYMCVEAVGVICSLGKPVIASIPSFCCIHQHYANHMSSWPLSMPLSRRCMTMVVDATINTHSWSPFPCSLQHSEICRFAGHDTWVHHTLARKFRMIRVYTNACVFSCYQWTIIHKPMSPTILMKRRTHATCYNMSGKPALRDAAQVWNTGTPLLLIPYNFQSRPISAFYKLHEDGDPLCEISIMRDVHSVRFGFCEIWILGDVYSVRLRFWEILILWDWDSGRLGFCEIGILWDLEYEILGFW